MTVAYNRSQIVLPPQLQHSVPSGHPSPFNYSQTSGNTASYGHYRPPRHGRGYRMPSSYSHSHQQLQYLHQACPHVSQTGEEPQALEETVTSNETEGGDEAAFPAIPGNDSLPIQLCHLLGGGVCIISLAFSATQQ
ncbi:hypothetical protein KIL84_008145 [Mauremys mutica]|uniref:Uncharacterized protein n=1 Tax=Mauremys mutica TaxID=74926 RepID=A0A9D4ANW0_9SAUR|nr:hypothetical protein KIL84_008145 [Mauremys mutica]